MPQGFITRGTTNPNRLRRNDNWITDHPHLRAALLRPGALLVDLGYGASARTTLELADRIRQRLAPVEIIGLEIDPDRVAAAAPYAHAGASFQLGGFELAGLRPSVVRAMNVLRQYDVAAAAAAWSEICGNLAPGGYLVEGTCCEWGRLASWVLLDRAGPVSLTLSMSLRHLDRPSTVAQRLPKALIHNNIPRQPIFELLRQLDAAWDRQAPLRVFGPKQRFAAAAQDVAAGGWPVLSSSRQHHRGEFTVTWAAVD